MAPRPSLAADRRHQLVRGLMSAMAKHGYAGAPVAAIAREAGLTPGLVHYYFDSKQEILLSVLHEIRAAVLARYEQRRARVGSEAWGRLFALTDALLEDDEEAQADVAAACWVALAAEAIHEPAVRRGYQELLGELVGLLQTTLCDVLAAEGRSRRNVAALATAVASFVHGVHHLDAAAPSLSPPGSSAPAGRKMVEGLVNAQPPATAGSRGQGPQRRRKRRP